MRRFGLAASLVLSPLFILVYWLLYPAYGELHAAEMLGAIAGHAAATATADIFVFVGVFLAVPASLAQMRVLEGKSPRLAFIGGALSAVGWIALVGAVMADVLATQMGAMGAPSPSFIQLFDRFMGSPFVIALNVVATLHLVGGILLGIAFVRTRVIPRWAGLIVAITPLIHLSSNIAGLLWIDAATWIALAAAYASVARVLLQTTD